MYGGGGSSSLIIAPSSIPSAEAFGTPTVVLSFNGDFSALAASFGLTVRADFDANVGVTGTTGSGKTAWANQTGDGSAMAVIGGKANGIGTPGAGLNGKASMITDGATQGGVYTFPSAAPPATTQYHIWAIERIVATPAASAHPHFGGANFGILTVPGAVNPDANILLDAGGGFVGPSTGAVVGQWYRIRASWLGGTIADTGQIGAHVVPPAASTNTAPGLSWGFGGSSTGVNQLQIETLRILHIEGTEANFNSFCAVADPDAQSWWTNAIEI